MNAGSGQVDTERENWALTIDGSSVPGDLPTPATQPPDSDPTNPWLQQAFTTASGMGSVLFTRRY